ncbi:hypothetical protein [Noviherbaspirillum aridicola]|uniref:Uncharacterized protein n=1 Tax=Noviherbaspirillum aridicola TaxID=2849687 RepID=A0ABQ4Q308_9BURK|nr:hypothetical protein [Noviherbaspirillum aridicola]GIZ51573.1 hypothetical protein NCCP691_15870 [Noviherbaspirillum aridicola]
MVNRISAAFSTITHFRPGGGGGASAHARRLERERPDPALLHQHLLSLPEAEQRNSFGALVNHSENFREYLGIRNPRSHFWQRRSHHGHIQRIGNQLRPLALAQAAVLLEKSSRSQRSLEHLERCLAAPGANMQASTLRDVLTLLASNLDHLRARHGEGVAGTALALINRHNDSLDMDSQNRVRAALPVSARAATPPPASVGRGRFSRAIQASPAASSQPRLAQTVAGLARSKGNAWIAECAATISLCLDALNGHPDKFLGAIAKLEETFENDIGRSFNEETVPYFKELLQAMNAHLDKRPDLPSAAPGTSRARGWLTQTLESVRTASGQRPPVTLEELRSIGLSTAQLKSLRNILVSLVKIRNPDEPLGEWSAAAEFGKHFAEKLGPWDENRRAEFTKLSQEIDASRIAVSAPNERARSDMDAITRRGWPLYKVIDFHAVLGDLLTLHSRLGADSTEWEALTSRLQEEFDWGEFDRNDVPVYRALHDGLGKFIGERGQAMGHVLSEMRRLNWWPDEIEEFANLLQAAASGVQFGLPEAVEAEIAFNTKYASRFAIEFDPDRAGDYLQRCNEMRSYAQRERQSKVSTRTLGEVLQDLGRMPRSELNSFLSHLDECRLSLGKPAEGQARDRFNQQYGDRFGYFDPSCAVNYTRLSALVGARLRQQQQPQRRPSPSQAAARLLEQPAAQRQAYLDAVQRCLAALDKGKSVAIDRAQAEFAAGGHDSLFGPINSRNRAWFESLIEQLTGAGQSSAGAARM